MKKVLSTLIMLLFAGSCVHASSCDYECANPYDMNNKLRSAVSIVTGINAITENRVAAMLKKEIFKIGSADKLKIKVDSYSSKDMKNGIFKSMKIIGKNVVLNDIHFTSIELKTLCKFNYVQQSGKEIVFKEDMPISFDIVLTPEDINETMTHSRYQKIIDDVNRLAKTYSGGLQVESTKVSIKNNKFYYVIAIAVPFVTKQPKIVVTADLRVRNGKIDYQNARITSGYIKIDLKRFDFILDYLNPLDFSVNFIKDKNAKFSVKELEIKDNTLYVSGIAIIPKD